MAKVIDAKTGSFVTYGDDVHIIDAETGEFFLASNRVGSNTNSASADIVGAFRYVASGTGSVLQICMQTGSSTYAWVSIISNTW